MKYSDEYLDHYADRFIAMRLSSHGVTLAQYLSAPWRYEHLALEPEGLLPRQRRIQARIDAEAIEEDIEAEMDGVVRRGGIAIEPMRHRRWPRRAPIRRAEPVGVTEPPEAQAMTWRDLIDAGWGGELIYRAVERRLITALRHDGEPTQWIFAPASGLTFEAALATVTGEQT